MPKIDWNPESYGPFRDVRLRPTLDLLNQVCALVADLEGDLGRGDGAASAS
ncbi:MAG: hypothetical protein WCS20_15480 [Alphaproteobacteria bacterium]|jgi:trans-aconitate methyltransferase